MANNDTNYVDYSAPRVFAAWLNDLNNVIYRILGNSSGAGGTGGPPANAAAVLTNLGLGSSGTGLGSPPPIGNIAPNTVAATTLSVTGPIEVNSGFVTYGACQLSYTNGTTITLVPKNGNLLTINGVNQQIPSGGVTLVSPTMSASTLYYIYAYMNSGVMTLVASTTGHTTSTANGVEVWTTDNTHTLVGMVYCATANTFTNTPSQRYVRSWFNDPGVTGFANFTASRASTSTTAVEINSEIRNNLLLWSGEILEVFINGISTNNTQSAWNATFVGIDGTITDGGAGSPNTAIAGANTSVTCAWPVGGLSEGLHYATLFGYVTSGTGTWAGGSTVGSGRTTVSTYVHK